MKSLIEPAPFGSGQLCELVHELDLLWCGGSPAGHRPQHGLVQPQRADLHR